MHAVATEDDDAKLRTVIGRRMKNAGLNPTSLATTLASMTGDSTSRDRFYKALSGKRSLTPETLALIARALGTSVTWLRFEAGVLSRDELAGVMRLARLAEDAIREDPFLADDDKVALLRTYQRMTPARHV